jgi:hypothetical protein
VRTEGKQVSELCVAVRSDNEKCILAVRSVLSCVDVEVRCVYVLSMCAVCTLTWSRVAEVAWC